MYKSNLLQLQPDNIYIIYSPLKLEIQLVRVSFVLSSFCGVIGRIFIDKVYGLVVWDYEIFFSTKYFIINSKISALCSYNSLVVLTYIYKHMHASRCQLKGEVDTPIPTLDLACTNTHTSRGIPFFSTSKSASLTYIYTQVAVYWRFGWWWQRHPYPLPRLIACTNTHIATLGCNPLSHLHESFSYTLAALHITCVLISPVWEE